MLPSRKWIEYRRDSARSRMRRELQMPEEMTSDSMMTVLEIMR
jgi:hypothetical protein